MVDRNDHAFSITTTTLVPRRRVLDILCNALDSNAFAYWLESRTLDEVWPEGWSLDDVAWLTDEERAWWAGVRRWYFAPLVEGGALTWRSLDGRECRLDLSSIDSGLRAMATKAPRHFRDLLAEEDDAVTADVFVQCCVLGGVVYG